MKMVGVLEGNGSRNHHSHGHR